jgi:hypothetical protein
MSYLTGPATCRTTPETDSDEGSVGRLSWDTLDLDLGRNSNHDRDSADLSPMRLSPSWQGPKAGKTVGSFNFPPYPNKALLSKLLDVLQRAEASTGDSGTVLAESGHVRKPEIRLSLSAM